MRGRIMRVEPPVHRCFVSLPCSELLNVFFFWHVSHIIIPAVCYSWNIWGGYRFFSWWVSKHFAEEFSVVICALYRGMKWPAWCCAGGQRLTWTRNPQLPSPHFHAPNARLRYLLQREVPKRAAVSCCLHRNLANRACLGQQVSHISTISSGSQRRTVPGRAAHRSW